MNKEEVTETLCQIVGLVYHSIKDYRYASDGICDKCPTQSAGWHFQHDGWTLDYIRQSVEEKLIRDGYTINNDYNDGIKFALKDSVSWPFPPRLEED